MSRTSFAAVVAIASFALLCGTASATTVRWGEDTRFGPQVWIEAAEGERVDLKLRAEGGTALHPEDIVVENAAGTLSTPGTSPSPGACDPIDVECDVPCRAEAPNRARCSVYDGYSRQPKPLNPLETPNRSFYSGALLWLSTGDDRVTVPVDNPTRFRLRMYGTGGTNTYDLSRVSAGLEAGAGDVVTSGVGANVGVGMWGPNTFHAVNGRADSAYCFYDGTYPQTMRLDPFDDSGTCAGDILPPPTGLDPVPAPPDAEDQAGALSDRVAAIRRCIDANVQSPGSCATP